ncbi:MAG: 8-hydroxy-5-deazaflavin:NADPH oxidoreductase [Actinomycetota bacterium]|jgi:predicted dinucleotide-binding enzyme|nr:8-hydroxy-5-deazaflavin:NADPH oxidoreductase [Actinomycetota bacterium]
MTTIGFIGSGHIGSSVARAALSKGYRVVMSNSRGPDTLTDLIADLGEGATAATSMEAASAGDFVVVSVPLKAALGVPVGPLAGKVVIDTDNYYFERDGHIQELDDHELTVSGFLQRHLVGAKVAKGFNHIKWSEILSDALPSGTPGRRALATASDFPDAVNLVTRFFDEIGFDAVNIGPLAESWRIERDEPGYGGTFDAAALRAKLDEAVRL